MAIDRELLKQVSARSTTEENGIAGLVGSIHRAPGLREWVTLESGALAPVPVKRDNRWGIVVLLAVPTSEADPGWMAPWGAIEWAYPTQEVVQKIDLRFHEETASLRTTETIPRQPAGTKVQLNQAERVRRQKALFAALEELLSKPLEDNVNLAPLAKYYSGLLPAAVYPYYWSLIPASREWLAPQVPVELDEAVATRPTEPESVAESASPAPTSAGNQPLDLSDRLGTWLHECLKLADSVASAEVTAELQEIKARLRLPGFRLAFVGEFSRGKSTLLNRLLAQEVLPIGSLPTTATLTSIIAGSEDRMEVSSPTAGKVVRSLEEASWDDLLATTAAGSEQDNISQVRLSVNNFWLQALDAELIDTPGAGDINERRAAIVFDLLSQCDAAVLVVSALQPLSLTEAAFLEQEVIGKHVPQILVVVSKLDEINWEEREQVMKVVQGRVARVSEAIPLLPSHPVTQTASDDVLAAIRSQIEAMVAKGERRAWRSQQVARQLVDALKHLIGVGEAALAAAQLNEQQREQARQKAQSQIRAAELEWERIRLELDRRRMQRDRLLREKLLNAKAELVTMLSLELSKTPNPKIWWERDLPFRLRRELLALGRRSEDSLLKAVAKDFEWLQQQVTNAFSVQMTRQATAAAEIPNLNPDFNDLEITPVQRFRLLARVGSGAALIGSYVLGGPAAIAVTASLGAGILSEQILNSKIEEQRQLIQQELSRAVEKSFDEYCRQLSERLRQLYSQLAETTAQEQRSWQSAQMSAIEASPGELADKPWQLMLNKAENLQQQILAAINNGRQSAHQTT